MQITDMLSQYNRNLANGVEVSSGTQGIKQIASSLSELSVGNVFEGNVTQMENGVVTLGMPDGKSIQARLDAGVSVNVGESMFFQVRSNTGAQIAIRPFSGGIAANPTLLSALKAANLQANGKMLTMVHAMMEQSMSIDKQSLAHMARLVMSNEGMDVTSLVQMVKLGIPVTEEMAAQFENYKSDQYAILDQLESVMELLPKQMAGGSLSQDGLLALNRQMLEELLGGEGALTDAASPPDGPTLTEDAGAAAGQQAAGPDAQNPSPDEAKALSRANAMEQAQAVVGTEPDTTKKAESDLAGKAEKEGGQPQKEAAVSGRGERNGEADPKLQPDTIRKLFTTGALQRLASHLKGVPGLSEHPARFSEGKLREGLDPKELLRLLGQAFSDKDPFAKQALSELASSKEYRALVKNVLERQWLIRPEELKTEHKVKELYERLDRQMEQMDRIVKSFGQSAPRLSDAASNVRSNIQFMNQVNQAYAYLQIPLKLAGQNAHSDLFVYNRRRGRKDEDGELSAFLHLDLDHLGSTDVSVKLRKKQVSANFYMADDLSYQLIYDHMDELCERLEKRGFQVKLSVSGQEKKVNFVEELLKQGSPSAGGAVHRYSFDVRA